MSSDEKEIQPPIDSANQMLEGQMFVRKNGEVFIIYDEHFAVYVKERTGAVVVLRLLPSTRGEQRFYASQEMMPCREVDDMLKDAVAGKIVAKEG